MEIKYIDFGALKDFEYGNKLYELANQAKYYVSNDPESCAIKLRKFVECFVDSVYDKYSINKENLDLYEKISNRAFIKSLNNVIIDSQSQNPQTIKKIIDILHFVRIVGNKAAHNATHKITKQDSQQSLVNIYILVSLIANKNRNSIDYCAIDSSVSLLEFVEIDNARSFTNDQVEFLKKFDLFLKDKNQHIFILNGYAGTGKTHIINTINEYLHFIQRTCIISSPTGRAAQVISQRLLHDEANTIHSLIYKFDKLLEFKEVDTNLKQNDENVEIKFHFSLKDENPFSSDCVYIFDESSMIPNKFSDTESLIFGSGKLLDDLLEFIDLGIKEHNKKVVFIGDKAQLPPINMNTSPTLDREYLEQLTQLNVFESHLKEVVRQDKESGILKLSLKLRQCLESNDFSKLKIDFDDNIHKIAYANLLDCYKKEVEKDGLEQVIMIASKNDEVERYNKAIREILGKTTALQNDDLLIVTRNFRGENGTIYNGDFVTLKGIKNESKETKDLFYRKGEKPIPIKVTFCNIIIEDSQGEKQEVKAIYSYFENLIKGENQPREENLNLALYIDFKMRFEKDENMKERVKMETERAVWEFENSQKYKELNEKEREKEIKIIKKETKSQVFVDELSKDPYYNALRVKFGYVITCHKAQGGEWKSVFIKCSTYHKNQKTKDYFKWLYTAITRSTNKAYLLDAPKLVSFIPSGKKVNKVNIY